MKRMRASIHPRSANLSGNLRCRRLSVPRAEETGLGRKEEDSESEKDIGVYVSSCCFAILLLGTMQAEFHL